MRVLIVEDETVAYENLAEMLHAIDPSIEIAANTESVGQTAAWLRSHPAVDLIFMDIRLSDGPAFALFDRVKVETPIVFTTAYDRYAVEAFRVNSLDYLLKPVKPEELRRALEKFRHWIPSDMASYFARLAALTPRPVYRDKILVPFRDRLLPVSLDDVACFHTADKCTQIIMADGRRYAYSGTLDRIMTMLDPARFARAGKQFIVARDAVSEIVVWFDSRLLVKLSAETPEPIYVSKNRAQQFKAWLAAGETDESHYDTKYGSNH